jgi:hypothetical protein
MYVCFSMAGRKFMAERWSRQQQEPGGWPAGRPGDKVEHGAPLFSRRYGQSTGVVIFTMITIALFCFACDQAFAWSFLKLGVLDSSVLETE